MTPEQIIQILRLEPKPVEGGMIRRTYLAADTIQQAHLPGRYRSDKALGSAIYYLLTSDPDSFSGMHKLATDELFHFYLGDPVEMLLLHPDGTVERVILGPDLLNGQMVQLVVPRGVWQGCHVIPGGRYALMGTTMAPSYGDEDYVDGLADELKEQYPQEAALIDLLTRN